MLFLVYLFVCALIVIVTVGRTTWLLSSGLNAAVCAVRVLRHSPEPLTGGRLTLLWLSLALALFGLVGVRLLLSLWVSLLRSVCGCRC